MENIARKYILVVNVTNEFLLVIAKLEIEEEIGNSENVYMHIRSHFTDVEW